MNKVSERAQRLQALLGELLALKNTAYQISLSRSIPISKFCKALGRVYTIGFFA